MAELNEVFLRRAIGAGVVFLAAMLSATLLPEPEQAPETPALSLRLEAPEPASPTVVEAPPLVDLDAERARAAERASAAPAPGAEPDPGPKTLVEPPEAPPARVEARPAAAPVGSWRVQVASFSEAARAEKTIAEFRRQSVPAHRETVTVNGRTMHRVILGPFGSEPEALRARELALRKGFADSRVQYRGD